MNETRGNRTGKHRSNGWVWAFFILLSINIAVLLGLFYLLQPTQTASLPNDNQRVSETDEVSTFELAAEKEELSDIINLYLDEELEEEFEGYSVNIDERVELDGEIEVFGFSVDFLLAMNPFVTENGNLQLRADSIQLGTIDLPVSLAMNILSQQLNLPEWIRINSDESLILVALNEFELENGVFFSMERIDLEENDIRVNIFLPDEAIR